MRKPSRTTIGILLGSVIGLFALGFVAFAASVMRAPDTQDPRADAIVVLTGGPTRIAEGSRLLRLDRGARLLISGVNKRTSKASLRKLSGLDPEKFACCVDVDYAALDTVGNATETSKWAAERGYDRLIVVTSNYHMPRSLVELARAMPGVELIPHPVISKKTRGRTWWLEPKIARAIADEYVKFLPAAARLLVSRAFGPWSASSIAGTSKSPPAKI